MTSLPIYSPTGLRMLSPRQGGCTRKWAHRYISRTPIPELFTELREQGTRLHAHCEQAKLTGTMPPQDDPEGVIAAAALGYWPEGVDWGPEVEVLIERATHAFRGTADMFGKLFVGDYKFTGDKKNLPDGRAQWVKCIWPRKMRGVTVEQLIEEAQRELYDDPQWIFYGCAAAEGFPDDAIVEGIWIYVVRPKSTDKVKQAKVIPVHLRETAGSLRKKLIELDGLAQLASYLKANYTEANQVPHQADQACGGVGIRCDYADECDIHNPKDLQMPSLAELMSQAGVTSTSAAAPVAAAPAPTNAPVEAAPAPSVNPPEAEAVDVQATKEQVEEKKTRKRKPKAAATTVNEESDAVSEEQTFRARVVSGHLGGVIELGDHDQDLIPVGAYVKVTVLA